MNKVKLVVLDVDGVLTPGKNYNEEHKPIMKQFSDCDMTAIKAFKSLGIPVVALTGDHWNKGFCDKRKINYTHAREKDGKLDKPKAIKRLAKTFNVELENVLFVGDDKYDLPALEIVGFPFCPANASVRVKNTLKKIIDKQKDVQEAYKNMLNNTNYYFQLVQQRVDEMIAPMVGGMGVIDWVYEICVNKDYIEEPEDWYEKLVEIDAEESK